jgi:glycosyltransferase involved in cell wall biosynthesis
MIVNSQATRRTLCQGISWTPAGRIHVLYNGVDLTPFSAARPPEAVRQDLGRTPQDRLLICVGELTTRKNAALLVAALPELLRRHPRTHVLLVGEGDQREPLRTRARAAGVEDHVHLLGFRDDVPDLLAAADVLVHPARVEGFGFAVAEGMAAGLPVVASRASSIPEIVVPGETGQLVPVDDQQALTAAIARYLDDAGLRAAHGEAGRRRVHDQFDLERQAEKLEAIFATELRRRRGDDSTNSGADEAG